MKKGAGSSVRIIEVQVSLWGHQTVRSIRVEQVRCRQFSQGNNI
jgi:hypothetical protein